jgi:predicted acylesterase/phospholipase RssA
MYVDNALYSQGGLINSAKNLEYRQQINSKSIFDQLGSVLDSAHCNRTISRLISINLNPNEQELIFDFLKYLSHSSEHEIIDLENRYNLYSDFILNDSSQTIKSNNKNKSLILHSKKLTHVKETKLNQYYNQIFVLLSENTETFCVDEFSTEMNSKSDKIHFIICHSMHCKKPINTVKIFNGKLPENVYHIQNRVNDFARIERIINGKSVGLVLSGGGCKGLAHLGILKALEEYKIPIDRICGTSIGAIVAFLWSYHRNSIDAINHARLFFMNNPTPWWDLNIIPKYSLYRGNKIDSIFKSQLSDHQIEDLWIPFFCNSSNLSKLEVKIHDRGSSVTALRASLAIPGIFPPVLFDDNLLVDGGVFNNLPVDIISSKMKGCIIASRVDKSITTKVKTKLPNILSTLYQSSMANTDMNTEKNIGLIDLYFEPQVSKYGLMQWFAFDQIIQNGYEYACQILSQLDDHAKFN